MKFEVYPIRCLISDDYLSESVKNIAREIATHYEAIADRGGEIIASHTIRKETISASTEGERFVTGLDYLFLVAKIPDDSAHDRASVSQ